MDADGLDMDDEIVELLKPKTNRVGCCFIFVFYIYFFFRLDPSNVSRTGRIFECDGEGREIFFFYAS